ncbi:ANTAR domain-containing response regulator [Noviherbaspirillum massiliense]|uniref:ANTAR domain-containing response regulator n=1 Tax=Noviherbaspirillum massiliense TaxID=1465823 RepID=UPI0002D538B5|nr:response regulator [Noviherbaspirillum massiliense]
MITAAVIDPNAISRNLLTSVLINGGYDVVGDANHSSAGIAGIVKLRPQLVCIDIGQPDAEGFERLEHLRQALPKALVFMVSGTFDATTIEAGVQRGVLGFIVKPFNGVAVLKTIRNAVLRLAKQHREKEEQGDSEG